MTAVVVAGGATQVSVECKSGIFRVVKQFLTAFHSAAEFFVLHGIHNCKVGCTGFTEIDQRTQTDGAHATAHKLVYVQGSAVVGNNKSLRCEAHLYAKQLNAGDCIQHCNFAAGFQSNKQIHTVWMISRCGCKAGVIQVCTSRKIFIHGIQINARSNRTHSVLEIQIESVTQTTAGDVVLFGGYPGRTAVR